MNGLTRFLDWLDEAAAGFIRLAYLLAGITAVALYFGAGHLPAIVEDPLNGILPWMLAAAVETHTYISARRVRAAWQEKNWTALKVNLGILAGLLAFSAWNQLNYLVETWIPPVGALPLPSWASYLVRALVVPCAFMAAAFLAPITEPVAVQIETEAKSTLRDVFKIARKQRRRMLKQAERDGRDMTGALVELIPDPETKRIVSHAYHAIGAPVQAVRIATVATDAPLVVEAAPAPSQPQGAPANPLDTTITPTQVTAAAPLSPVAYTSWPQADDQPDQSDQPPEEPSPRPPTGGGTPVRRRRTQGRVITPDQDAAPNVTRLPAPRTRRSRRTAARGRGPRLSVEQKAREAFRLGMSASELARTAHIGKSAASKYRTALTIEALQSQAAAQTTNQVTQVDQAEQQAAQ